MEQFCHRLLGAQMDRRCFLGIKLEICVAVAHMKLVFDKRSGLEEVETG